MCYNSVTTIMDKEVMLYSCMILKNRKMMLSLRLKYNYRKIIKLCKIV